MRRCAHQSKARKATAAQWLCSAPLLPEADATGTPCRRALGGSRSEPHQVRRASSHLEPRTRSYGVQVMFGPQSMVNGTVQPEAPNAVAARTRPRTTLYFNRDMTTPFVVRKRFARGHPCYVRATWNSMGFSEITPIYVNCLKSAAPRIEARLTSVYIHSAICLWRNGAGDTMARARTERAGGDARGRAKCLRGKRDTDWPARYGQHSCFPGLSSPWIPRLAG